MPRNQEPGDEQKPVRNLDDLIRAREERTSAFADDVDNQDDINIPDDIDVDDALTFPHPRSKKKEKQPRDVDDELDEETNAIVKEGPDITFDYEDSYEEMLPSDYTGAYSNVMSTEVTDDHDEIVEERIDEVGDLDANDLIYNSDTLPEPLPKNFKGNEDIEDETT